MKILLGDEISFIEKCDERKDIFHKSVFAVISILNFRCQTVKQSIINLKVMNFSHFKHLYLKIFLLNQDHLREIDISLPLSANNLRDWR